MLRIRGFVLVFLTILSIVGHAETRILLPTGVIQRYGPTSVLGREASEYRADPIICAATSDIHWVFVGSVYGLEVWDIEARTQTALLNDLGTSIVAIAVSPMDDLFAYTDGTVIQIVTIPELEKLVTLDYSGDYPLASVAFDNLGEVLAGGSLDGTVTLWSIDQGRPMHRLFGQRQPIYGLAFTELSATPDTNDTHLVAACGPFGTNLWNLATGSMAPGRTLEVPQIFRTSKYPVLLKGFEGYEGVIVIDGWPESLNSYGWTQALSSLHEAATPADKEDPCAQSAEWEAVLAPTSDIVAVIALLAQEDSTKRWQTTFWNNLTGDKLATADLRAQFVFFSRDARRAVLVGLASIRLWGLEEMLEMWEAPLAPERFVQTGIYSHENGYVAAMRSSSQSSATLRAINNDLALFTIEEPESDIQVPVSFSRSGDLLAVDSLCGQMSVYSIADEEIRQSIIVRGVCLNMWDYPWPVDFGGETLATVTSRSLHPDSLLVHFLDPEFRSAELPLPVPATCIAINASGSLAFVAEGKTIRILDTASAAILETLEVHAGEVSALALSSDETLLFAGGNDGKAVLWNLARGFSLEWIGMHTSAVTATSFGVGTRIAATGTQEGAVILWDIQTGHRLRELRGHLSAIREIHFSPYDGQLVSLDSSGMLLVWDVSDVYSPGNTVEMGGFTLDLVQSLSLSTEIDTLPRIALFVRATGGTEWTLWSTAVVDSGATALLFPAALGETLGLDIQAGSKFKLIGATGIAEGWEHGVELGFAYLHSTESGADGYMLARNGIPYLLKVNAIFSYSASEVLLGGTALMHSLDFTNQGGLLTVTAPEETVLGH